MPGQPGASSRTRPGCRQGMEEDAGEGRARNQSAESWGKQQSEQVRMQLVGALNRRGRNSLFWVHQ